MRRRRFARWSGLSVSICGRVLLLAASALCLLPEARATHFRFGYLNWAPTTTSGEVEFHLVTAFRRSGYSGSAPDGFPQTGDVIVETIGATGFNFGDGQSTPTLSFRVRAFSVAENWIIGEALHPGTTRVGLRHTYAGAGPYTAGINTCCRLSSLNNRADGPYILDTTVAPRGNNRSAVPALVPIVIAPAGGIATFTVPAVDPDADRLRWRLATEAEAGGGAHPPNLSINPTNGSVTWNTAGLNTNNPWTTQVIIEDLDGAGNVRSETPVDFILQIRPDRGTAPVCTVSPASTFDVPVNTPISFTINGTDADPGAVVTLNSGGLPGGTTSPPLPTSGPSGVQATFNWTPTAPGSHQIVFSATDETGRQHLCPVTITVRPATPPVCNISPAGPFNVVAGTPISFAITGTDADAGATVTLNTEGLPPGAATTPALPVSGPSGIQARFDWTPTQAGSNHLVFSATDNTGRQHLCPVTVIVRTVTPPVCTIDPPGPFTVIAGTTITFTIAGTDADAGATVTLNTEGLPPGAATTPALPVSGPSGVQSRFDWTPTQAGSNYVVFSATDNTGRQHLCPVAIIVRTVTRPVCTIDPSGPFDVVTGTPIAFTITGSDADAGATVTLNAAGLPAGATTTPALPASGPSGVQAKFDWIPTQPGTYPIMFTATDETGLDHICPVMITVRALSDLSIGKVAAPDPAKVTSNIFYLVSVTNNGPSDAVGVTLADFLPAGVAFVVATASQGSCQAATGVVTCDLGGLAPGGAATVLIEVTAIAEGSITNYARVTSATADPDALNNEVAVATTILPLNDAPVADASATEPIIISPNNVSATARLDASRSSDPDGDALSYHWFEGTTVLAGTVTAEVVLLVGVHRIDLVVSDGESMSTDHIEVAVITPCDAVQLIKSKLQDAGLGRKQTRPLNAVLDSACRSFTRGKFRSGVLKLFAFQHKVGAQITRIDPVAAQCFIDLAQDIIDAVGITPGDHGDQDDDDDAGTGARGPRDD